MRAKSEAKLKKAMDESEAESELVEIVERARTDVRLRVSKLTYLIGEIDAIGGTYYVPPELRDIIEIVSFVKKGSLAYLADPENYFPETGEFEELGKVANRVQFLRACRLLDHHEPLQTQLRLLNVKHRRLIHAGIALPLPLEAGIQKLRFSQESAQEEEAAGTQEEEVKVEEKNKVKQKKHHKEKKQKQLRRS